MRVEINEQAFKNILDGTKHCVCKDGSRPALEYIKIKVEKNCITAYSLDGYRAGKVVVECNTVNPDEFSCYIKPLPFKPSKNGIQPVIIEADEENVYVETQTEYGSLRYGFKQMKWDIDIEKIYADAAQHDRELCFDATFVGQALKALSLINTNRQHPCVIEGKSNNLQAFIIRTKGEGVKSEQLILPIRLTV